jgi:hypothetical protein
MFELYLMIKEITIKYIIFFKFLIRQIIKNNTSQPRQEKEIRSKLQKSLKHIKTPTRDGLAYRNAA